MQYEEEEEEDSDDDDRGGRKKHGGQRKGRSNTRYVINSDSTAKTSRCSSHRGGPPPTSKSAASSGVERSQKVTLVSPLVPILPPHLTYHSTGQNLAALHANQGLESLLVALDLSLASGSLAESLRTHDDLQGELTELVLGVYSLAPASTALAQAARRVLMALIMVAGGPGGNPIVLRALLPLLTMKAGRNGLPSDARARTSAHQKAVAVLRTLIEKGEEQKRAHFRKCGVTEDSQQDGDAKDPGEGGGAWTWR